MSYSPQMEKWLRDAEQHGLRLNLNRRPRRGGGRAILQVTGQTYITEAGVPYITEDASSFYIPES